MERRWEPGGRRDHLLDVRVSSGPRAKSDARDREPQEAGSGQGRPRIEPAQSSERATRTLTRSAKNPFAPRSPGTAVRGSWPVRSRTFSIVVAFNPGFWRRSGSPSIHAAL